MFDSVLRRDSTLFPALIHPIELSLMYRDSARFERYFPAFAGMAPPAKVSALRTAANLAWGPLPSEKALGLALAEQPSWILHATHSAYYRERATSDSIRQLFTMVQRAGPKAPEFVAGGMMVRAQALAGLGRWREARVLIDSLRILDAGKARNVEAWSVALGLAPPSLGGLLDSAVKAVPPGPQAEYANSMLHFLRGQVPEGRSRIARALATRDSPRLPPDARAHGGG